MPFLLLVGAAPNAIAYSSKQFTPGEFFRYGTLASIMLMVVIGLAVTVIWTLPVGVALVDGNMQVQYLNPQLSRLCGYSLQEAAGIDADYILRPKIETGSAPLVLEMLLQKIWSSKEQISCKGTMLNRRRQIIAVRFTISRVAASRAAAPLQTIVVVEEQPAAAKEAAIPPLSTKMVGSGPQMTKVLDKMAIFARTDASILITGETGCGKDLLAEELHNASDRAKHPFIKVNCGALPEALLESELFGHKRGAFTGAVNDHPGMFRLANKGTLFLTEIGDLSLPLQVKLLSVLDDHKFFPVGSTTEVNVDIRLIAATHRNLREEVALGRFREDLFFRLNVLHLEVPPLRARREDLRLLILHFLRQSADRIKKTAPKIGKEAQEILLHYPWPGNVRELRNVMEYSVNICQGATLSTEDLPDYLLTAEQPFQEEQTSKKSLPSPPSHLPGEPPNTSAPHHLPPLSLTWKEIEKQRIIDALQQSGGHKGRAAALLGMGRTTLWRKIRLHNISFTKNSITD